MQKSEKIRYKGENNMSTIEITSKIGGTHEINIGAGTLSRPIEEVAATLLHEMVHYYNHVKGVQDCSRGNTYHNRKFRDAATAHGLIVDHHEKYGWTITSPVMTS